MRPITNISQSVIGFNGLLVEPRQTVYISDLLYDIKRSELQSWATKGFLHIGSQVEDGTIDSAEDIIRIVDTVVREEIESTITSTLPGMLASQLPSAIESAMASVLPTQIANEVAIQVPTAVASHFPIAATDIIQDDNHNFITIVALNKLDAIEDNANAYVHPATHSADIIVETANKVFVTEAERTKLGTVETSANAYIHPTTHPASMIVTNETAEFVTATQKTIWDSKAAGDHQHTSGRIIWVDVQGNDANTGASSSPLASINAAVTMAKNMTPAPTTDSPVAIWLNPGRWAEHVIIDRVGINLYGYGKGITQIINAGTCITLQDNGSIPPPWNIIINGIKLESTNDEYALRLEGRVGSNLGREKIQIENCHIAGTNSIYSTMANNISFLNSQVDGNELYYQNTKILTSNSSHYNITVDYDEGSSNKPANINNEGLFIMGSSLQTELILLHNGKVGEAYSLVSTSNDVPNASSFPGTTITDSFNILNNVYQTIWVDKNNIETYIANGSKYRPYKTVTEALASIIDASSTKPYALNIGPGTYDETPVWKDCISAIGCGTHITKLSGINYTGTSGSINLSSLQIETAILNTSTNVTDGIKIDVGACIINNCSYTGGTNTNNSLLIAGGSSISNLVVNSGHFDCFASKLNNLTIESGISNYGTLISTPNTGTITVKGQAKLSTYSSPSTADYIGVEVEGNKPTLEFDPTSYTAGIIIPAQWNFVYAANTGYISNSSVIPGITVKNALDYLTIATKVLYVDKNRTETYVENGSFHTPFKTIQAAINQIATNNDNSTYPYTIDIIGPGTYAENLVFASDNFKNVVLIGHDNVTINPTTGNSLDCVTNNATFSRLQVYGILFFKPVNLIGHLNSGNTFANDCNFIGCLFASTVTAKNLVVFDIYGSKVNASLILENIITGVLADGAGQGPFDSSITYNAANPKPDGATNAYFMIERTVSLANWTISTGAVLQVREGVRLGSGGGTTTINGDLIAYSSWIWGNIIINNGGKFTNRGSFYNPTLLTVNSGGSLVNETKAGVIGYDPATIGNWVTTPTNLQDATDILASDKISKNGISGNFTTVDGKTITVVDGQITAIT